MRQSINATLPAQGQPKFSNTGFKVSKPAVAAKLLRNDWDDTILYKHKVGVLMLDDFQQPIGTAYEYIHEGKIVNRRKLCNTISKSNTAHVFLAINSPIAHYHKTLILTKDNAEELDRFSHIMDDLDIHVMGFFVIDPFDHVFIEDNIELLKFEE